MKIMNRFFFSIMLFLTVRCFAAQPTPDVTETPYQKNFNLVATDNLSSTFKLKNVTEIPEATYRYLEAAFSSFYKKITFNTAITDSTFEDTLESSVVALPLIAENPQGIKFEVFGHFYDLSKQYLSNLSADHYLYEHLANSERSDYLDQELSLGAGVSFNTGKSSKVKLIISNNDMPGYGNSRTLVGFETRF